MTSGCCSKYHKISGHRDLVQHNFALPGSGRPLLMAALLSTAVAGFIAVGVHVETYRHSMALLSASCALCCTLFILLFPRLLWFQLKRGVAWENVCEDRRSVVTTVMASFVVTLAALTVCIVTLVLRFRADELLHMDTVSQIGSTLFLAKEMQRVIVRPVLWCANYFRAERENSVLLDLQERPPLEFD